MGRGKRRGMSSMSQGPASPHLTADALPVMTTTDEACREWRLSDGSLFTGVIDWGENGHAYIRKGKLDRDGDMPAIDEPGVKKEWWINGKRTRANNQPAVHHFGSTRLYYVDDRLHRTNGPAVVYATGNKEYWLCGVRMSKEEWRLDADVKVELEYARIKRGKLEHSRPITRSRTSLLAD